MCLMKSHANVEEEIIERVPRRFCKQIPDALENKQISNDDAKFFWRSGIWNSWMWIPLQKRPGTVPKNTIKKDCQKLVISYLDFEVYVIDNNKTWNKWSVLAWPKTTFILFFLYIFLLGRWIGKTANWLTLVLGGRSGGEMQRRSYKHTQNNATFCSHLLTLRISYLKQIFFINSFNILEKFVFTDFLTIFVLIFYWKSHFYFDFFFLCFSNFYRLA